MLPEGAQGQVSRERGVSWVLGVGMVGLRMSIGRGSLMWGVEVLGHSGSQSEGNF